MNHSSVLSNLKLAVINGKDRQSDYLSYATTGPIVQETLKLAKTYKCTRVPENILSFNESAKKQPKILFPTAVQANRNGDVFILDSGASCVHSVDRSSVAKMFSLGGYMKPSNVQVSSKNMVKASLISLSNDVVDMCFSTDRDDLYIVDSGKSEIIISRNVAFASALPTSSINIWRIEGIKSICFYKGNIVCLQHHKSDFGIVYVFDLDLPAVSKTSPLVVTPKQLKRIKFGEHLTYVFSMSSNFLGLVSAEKEIIVCHNPVGKCLKQMTGIKAMSKPQLTLDGSIAYFPQKGRQINHLNFTVSPKKDKDKHIKFVYLNKAINVPETTTCFTVWGSTYQIVSKCSGVYSLMEHGKLDFGLRLSTDINSFYSAISYRPPYGYVSGQRKSLKECIKLAQPFLETLNLIKAERKEKYPARKQIYGFQGAVFGDTVKCIEDTVSSWEANVRRLEFFDADLAEKADPHAFTNENLIEHSFGFIKLQGQSQLQSFQEYVHNKQKHEIDFQLKLCNLNFCQKVKVKLRDKSYQHIDDQQKSVLDAGDLWDILGLGQKKDEQGRYEVDPADAKVLQHAYLVTKAVPRQSNRAKWKDQSGHAPTMPTVSHAFVDVGDLVFCLDPFENLHKLLVKEKVEIRENSVVSVSVIEGDTTTYKNIPITSLLMDKGLLFVVPSGLFKIDNNRVQLSDIIASQLLQDCLDDNATRSQYSDEQLVQLPTESDESNEIEELPTKKFSKKRKYIVETDSEEDENVGRWVICKFVIGSKVNYYLGQEIFGSSCSDKQQFQFYRLKLPGLKVYVKLPSTEEHDKTCIVSFLPKNVIDIVGGDMIKIKGTYSLEYKCV